MSNPIPKQWRCQHCNECVDPTMQLCWNCGCDREGNTNSALFANAIEDVPAVCASCGYDLRGTPDALSCPECGALVPWADCADCGVRIKRSVMETGCPVCRAKNRGLTFIPEVVPKEYSHCPHCRYDLRGSPDANSCPECGVQIDRGVYETCMEDEIQGKPKRELAIRRERRLWVLATFALIPLLFVAVILAGILDQYGEGELVVSVLVGWAVIAVFCIIQNIATYLKMKNNHGQ